MSSQFSTEGAYTFSKDKIDLENIDFNSLTKSPKLNENVL